jgi:hypothetical protein
MSRQQPQIMWYKDALYDDSDRPATAAHSDEDETTVVEMYEEIFINGAALWERTRTRPEKI